MICPSLSLNPYKLQNLPLKLQMGTKLQKGKSGLHLLKITLCSYLYTLSQDDKNCNTQGFITEYQLQELTLNPTTCIYISLSQWIWSSVVPYRDVSGVSNFLTQFFFCCSLISVSSVQSPHSNNSHSGLTMNSDKIKLLEAVQIEEWILKKNPKQTKEQAPEVSWVSHQLTELVYLVFTAISVHLKMVILF